ncbi:MAG: hypothetical protein SGPRY_009020 [Prymnesium sp.]
MAPAPLFESLPTRMGLSSTPVPLMLAPSHTNASTSDTETPLAAPSFVAGASGARGEAASQDLISPLEESILNACCRCFESDIRPQSEDVCTEIAQLALALERGATKARNNQVLSAGTARANFLVAIFQRLTPGEASGFDRGTRGPGVGRLQCIEIVGMPLGVRNAVAVKGSWKIDEDDQGSIFISSYDQIEAAGGSQMLSLPNAGEATLTAIEHAGSRQPTAHKRA